MEYGQISTENSQWQKKNGIEKTLIWQDLSGLNFLSIYNNMVFSHAFADGLPVSWSYV